MLVKIQKLYAVFAVVTCNRAVDALVFVMLLQSDSSGSESAIVSTREFAIVAFTKVLGQTFQFSSPLATSSLVCAGDIETRYLSPGMFIRKEPFDHLVVQRTDIYHI